MLAASIAMYWGHHYWGMHAFWWIFWVALVVGLMFWVWRPTNLRARDSALEILRRKYAAGEITEEEYRHRRTVLDEPQPPVRREPSAA